MEEMVKGRKMEEKDVSPMRRLEDSVARLEASRRLQEKGDFEGSLNILIDREKLMRLGLVRRGMLRLSQVVYRITRALVRFQRWLFCRALAGLMVIGPNAEVMLDPERLRKLAGIDEANFEDKG